MCWPQSSMLQPIRAPSCCASGAGRCGSALFFTVSSVFWVGVTALLASWSTPAWALVIPAPIAVGAAFLATLAFLRYRWLRR